MAVVAAAVSSTPLHAENQYLLMKDKLLQYIEQNE